MTSRQSVPIPTDVRMRGFTHRVSVADALAWVDANSMIGSSEPIGLAEAAGRVLSRDVISNTDVPRFERAMMDGFAVLASDTSGAAPYNRISLHIVGSALPGQPFDSIVAPGHAVRIMTGAPLPDGTDAVLPVEYTEVEADRVFVLRELPIGKHVGRRGEDIRENTRVLQKGRRLRPQDIGLLASIGESTLDVVRRVRVRIVVTGDELLPPGSRPRGCSIVDSNSPMLTALVNRDGGEIVGSSIVPDEPKAILNAMYDDVEVVLVSGGSSVGQEDHAPTLLAQNGELAIHGIAMRPSSPTGMGRLGHRLVFLLPGNPVSCMCSYDFFAGRAIRIAAGLDRGWPYRTAPLPLARKIVSVVGRVDYARIAINDDRVETLAIAGASVLSSTTRADGFVIIPADSEGYPAGKTVDVYLYE